jgi:LmbE family N-acetylglucosaminyl deacetylase
MRRLALHGIRSVVAVGAHPDDIEIGAGGLLLGLPPGTRVHYVLCTGSDERQAEARDAATAFLPTADLSFALHDLPDGRLPAHWGEVKEILECAARTVDADLVLCPTRDDSHQDHRTVAEIVPTAFRDNLVLQYEIPKTDGDLTRRAVYVPLSPEALRTKVSLLNKYYQSQLHRRWWDDEVFTGLARLRGAECGNRYAEAYSSPAIVLIVD